MTSAVDDAGVDRVTAPAPQGRGRIRALTIGAVALISLTAFEALAVATVMPQVAADLNGLGGYALAFGAPLATSVVGMALAGAWADGVGARRPLGVGVLLFAVGLLLAGFAPQMAVFVLGRGVQGLGAGMETVALYALVGTVVPEPQRPRIFVWFSAAWVLPAMVGPAISALLLHVLGWRSVFLLIPALALPAGLVMWPVVRTVGRDSAPSTAAGAREVRRRLVLAAAAGSGAAVLQAAGARPESGWRAAAAAALVVVLCCGRRLLPEGLFRLRRGVPAVVALRGLIGAAFVGADTYLPLLLVREHGWDPGAAGLVLTLGALTWSGGSWIQGRYPRPEIRYVLCRIGTSMLAAAVVIVLLTALPGAPGWTAVIGWAVAGTGMGLAYSSTSLLALHLSPPERHGEASSALTTSEALTSSAALALAGAVFAALLPAHLAAGAGHTPFVAALAVPVLAAALAVVAAWRAAPRARQR
ncbi:MAG TPA: MFS transporter [Kineosporiaceae bacterium]